MENNEKPNLNEDSENTSLTPIRAPSEDITAGARQDDQLEKLKKNAEKDPVDSEKQIGIPPTAYPGPEKGNVNE